MLGVSVRRSEGRGRWRDQGGDVRWSGAPKSLFAGGPACIGTEGYLMLRAYKPIVSCCPHISEAEEEGKEVERTANVPQFSIFEK